MSGTPIRKRSRRLDRWLIRGGATLAVLFSLSALGGWTEARARHVALTKSASSEALAAHLSGRFDSKIDRARDDMTAIRLELERRSMLEAYVRRFRISHELAGAIHDAATDEGIQPALAFRLVQVESNFRSQARSSAAALGYTQIQVRTARAYEPNVTEAQLYDREMNLRLGFRYLRDLLRMFDGDMHLALLAYNRGPGRVEQILAEGGDPRNGYSSTILRTTRRTAPQRGMN